MKKIYASEIWSRKINRQYEVLSDLKATKYKNAYILPYRYKKNNKSGFAKVFEGGVVNEWLEFVAGTSRSADEKIMNFECRGSYEFDKNSVEYIDKDVVFGGEIINAFGHCLTDSMTRLWYIIENMDFDKIIFCTDEEKSVPPYFVQMLEFAGIDKTRWECCEEIKQYRNVIVPDQAWIMFRGFHKKLNFFYDKIAENIMRWEKKEFSNSIYLSRTQYKNQDCFGEEFFEEFYRRRGYEILYPEQMSLSCQIKAIRNADNIVCTGGTLSHLILFAKLGVKVTILTRCNQAGALLPQFMIDQAKKADYIYVNIDRSFLPTTHAGGVFLVGITDEWKEYTKDLEGDYDVFDNDYVEKNLLQYIKAWVTKYSKWGYSYKKVKNMDFFDVLNYMNISLFGSGLDRNVMKSPKLATVSQTEYDSIKNNYKLLEEIYNKEVNEELIYSKQREPMITYKVHFTKVGWKEGFEEFERAGDKNTKRYIEAICFERKDNSPILEYGVFVDEEWKKGKIGEVIGTTGQGKHIKSFYCCIRNLGNKKFCYRVGCGEAVTPWYISGEMTQSWNWNGIEWLEIQII